MLEEEEFNTRVGEPKPAITFFRTKEPHPQKLNEAQDLLLASNLPAAIQTYRYIASAGSPKAMMALGNFYRKGEGVQRDLKQAEQWFLRAIALDFVPAVYCLGLTYLKLGYYRKATIQFNTAAHRGFLPAVYMLGEMYYRGQGIERNLDKAKELWELANKKQFVPAKIALAKLLMSGSYGVLVGFRGVWLHLEAVIMRRHLQKKNRWDERLG